MVSSVSSLTAYNNIARIISRMHSLIQDANITKARISNNFYTKELMAQLTGLGQYIDTLA